jgi:adenine-specific DNA methylase
MGVGHLLGLMPDELLPGVRRTGVELDSITARIAQRLYPDSTIFAKGFEETPLPDNYFDAVIGNIPFGNYPVYDPAYRRQPVLTRTIHDYFLAKSLDKLRPGGVMALVTSRYTMDKQDSTIQRYLVDRADLIGAIRLPNTAFKANAGTEVTTDILFLQKRPPGAPASPNAWLDLAPFETSDA